MSFAFGHLVFSWLIGKSKEKISKTKLLRVEWFLLLFGAVFPDGDYLIDWIFGINFHRTITHSFLMVLLSFLVIYFVCYFFDKKLNGKRLGLFFAIGILSHLIADFIMGSPGVPLLWPLEYRFWLWGFSYHYIHLTLEQIPKEELVMHLRWAIFDMGLGVLWLGYLFFKNKIKEF